MGADIFVAQNARFDLSFLNRLMRSKYGFPPQNLAVDTLILCQLLLPINALEITVKTVSHKGPNQGLRNRHFSQS